jgi:transcriptional regulator with XRE-family HTH domain
VRDSQIDPRERNLVLWLQKQRLRQGISAAQLAAKIGMSRAAITHIEANRCRPTLATLLKISDGLKLRPSKWKW